MKAITLCTILILACNGLFSQNLIGSTDQEIRKYMIENRKDMNFIDVRNSMYSYLKYSDNSERQTILFFLDNNRVCSSVRLICETSMKPDIMRELDESYIKKGKDRWVDSHEGKKFLVRLSDEEWACTITIEPEK